MCIYELKQEDYSIL